MILCEVNKNNLKVRTSELLTAGSREVNEVEFRFNSAWDGVAKTAVFRTEKKIISVFLSTNNVKIPWEVLEDVGEIVAVGVYGVSDGTLILPTVWGIIGKVVDAAHLGEEEKEPTPEVYQQILDRLMALKIPSWDGLPDKPFNTIGTGLSVDEDGNLNGTEQVQADWNENDSKTKSFIKNRTHYDSRVEETVEKTFTLTSESTQMQKLFDDFSYDDIAKLKSIAIAQENFKADGTLNRAFSWKWNSTDNTIETIDASSECGATAGSVYVTYLDGVLSGVNSDEEAWDEELSCRLYLFAKEDVLSNEQVTAQGVTSLGLYYDYRWIWDDSPSEDVPTFKDNFTIVRETGELKTIEPKYIAEVDPTAIKDMYSETTSTDYLDYTVNMVLKTGTVTHDEIPFELGQKWEVYTDSDLYATDDVKQTNDGVLYIGSYPNPAPYYITKTEAQYIQGWMNGIRSLKIVCIQNATIITKIPSRYLPDGVFTQDNAPIQFGSGTASTVQQGCIASGNNSHAEGHESQASGECAHAEGYGSMATANYSHAEGIRSKASGSGSHAEGHGSQASGECAHAEGYESQARGDYSHASGYMIKADGRSTSAFGEKPYRNSANTAATSWGSRALIVGNGGVKTSSGTKANESNALELDWDGNGWFAGDVYVGSTSGAHMDGGSVKLLKETDVSSWAKQATKPTYTASEVEAVATAQGTANSGKYLGVGTDGNVTTVDAPSGGEGEYELIQTVTLTEDTTEIVLTQESDGTAYDFSRMKVTFRTPFVSSGYVNVYFANEDANTTLRAYVRLNDSSASGRIAYCAAEAYKECGRWRVRKWELLNGYSTINSSNVSNVVETTPSYYEQLAADNIIKYLRIVGNGSWSIPSGTIINIWGVRA